VLAPLAGLAAAAALLAGCSGADEEPAEDTTAAAVEQSDGGGEATATDEQDSDEEGSDETPTQEESSDGDDSDDPSDSADPDDSDGTEDSDDPAEDAPEGEDLFTGTWGFGHDEKTLDSGQLAAVLEDEAAARGPSEMTLSVECGDGVDTETQDYEAECIAYADEGVEHLWKVTVGPAGPGIDVEVENAG
jgi:hypothetical protein